MSDSIKFTENLIKGKITELIFQRMFLESGEFKVLPLGYENTLPELAMHEHKNPLIKKVTENLRNTPDFALISNKDNSIFLVEVKYRHQFKQGEIKELAEKIHNRWDFSHLFLATPEGFYFDSTAKIKEAGIMNPLRTSWIELSYQEQYQSTLNSFIQ
jgi:hypothetical protein